jgi:hypothetical protein
VLTAAWGRSTLTQQVLLHYAGIHIPGLDLELVCVVSPEDPDPAPYVEPWKYVEIENKPLGKKWNLGTDAMIDLDVDALMVVGSDDFVSWTYFDLVLEQLRRGSDVISSRDLYVYEPPSEYVAYCESMVPGLGRTLTRGAIRALKDRLWDSDAPGYLDSSLMRRLRQAPGLRMHNARNMGDRDFALLDVKLSEGPNIWTLVPSNQPEKMDLMNETGHRLHIRRVTYIPARQFFKDYFPHITNYQALGRGDPYARTT